WQRHARRRELRASGRAGVWWWWARDGWSLHTVHHVKGYRQDRQQPQRALGGANHSTTDGRGDRHVSVQATNGRIPPGAQEAFVGRAVRHDQQRRGVLEIREFRDRAPRSLP